MSKRSGRGLVFMISTMTVAAVSALYAYTDRQSTQQVRPIQYVSSFIVSSECTMGLSVN